VNTSAKFLLWTLGLGIIYSIFKLLSGTGGGGLEDSIEALAFVSLLISILSFGIIILNIRKLKTQIIPFVFLLISLPSTIAVVKSQLLQYRQNRALDLTPQYSRPVSQSQYLGDSLHIKVALDSLVALENRITGGSDIDYGEIDTIIYSPTGNEVFIIYYFKYLKNERADDLYPGYLSGTERNPDFWNLREGKSNTDSYGGNYHELSKLKMNVRKFYFNNYSFNPKDSSKENYFWR
jgi:hypothetical protein